MKKIMNKPGDIIEEMLNGLVLCDSQLKCFPEQRVVTKAVKEDKVGLGEAKTLPATAASSIPFPT